MKNKKIQHPTPPGAGPENHQWNKNQYVVDAMGIDDIWRVFRIMAEFTESFEALGPLKNAVSVFGSARTPEGIRTRTSLNWYRIAQEGLPAITGRPAS